MSKKQLIASSLYAVVSITAGLLIHPYQTMQSLVKEKLFIWLSLTPLGILAVVTLVWKLSFVPLLRMILSCSNSHWLLCDSVTFFSNTVTFFCLYWQIVLGYLLLRFRLIVFVSEYK